MAQVKRPQRAKLVQAPPTPGEIEDRYDRRGEHVAGHERERAGAPRIRRDQKRQPDMAACAGEGQRGATARTIMPAKKGARKLETMSRAI